MKPLHFPRWAAPPTWAAGLLLFHIALPWSLSTLSYRHGWSTGRPGSWNLGPLVLVAGGIGVIIWALVEHFERAAHGWELLIRSTPEYLLVRGPYRYTRNPMYVAALAIWSGWVLFYGSIAMMLGLAVLWAVIALVVIPYEERKLAAELGESYLQYKSRVARWFGTL